MDKGLRLQTFWFDTLDSTQTYLVDAVKSGVLVAPAMVVARTQTAGKGSRGNTWQSLEGNLFFSFALHRTMLPDDLPLSAASIYFSFLLKELLAALGSAVWVKWPNDFYLNDKKIGGTITTICDETLVCGIGINTQQAPNDFSHLDISITHEELLKQYQESLFKRPQWKIVLKKFEIEFDQSKSYTSHAKNSTISLKNARLCEDGSLMVDGQRIYSLR